MSKKNLRHTFLILLCISISSIIHAGNVKGRVFDAKTQEALVGVTVFVVGTNIGTSSDTEGYYSLKIPKGKFVIKASYVSYQTIEITDVDTSTDLVLDIPMKDADHGLGEVTVVGMRKLSTEVSVMETMRLSNSVVSGVSSQQIAKNQDRDASEVMKRIPGISIIDEKFIIARGLSQRYNNVWINNASAPSSESDTRSFSFDIIPSSQIENIMVVKSPMPELPADFSGGFIKLTTKGIPSANSTQLSIGTNYNPQTHFKNFEYNDVSNYWGFDGGKSNIASFVGNPLNNNDPDAVLRATKEGFNNDWVVKNKRAMPDQRFSLAINRRYKTSSTGLLGLVAAANFSHATKTYLDMNNSRYGAYNVIKDEPDYVNKYSDNQYSIDSKLGLMANLVYSPNGNHRFEFRNMANRLSKNRYTDRVGFYNSSGFYSQGQREYLYSNRTTYSGQLSGKHTLAKNKFDWTLGYSYANKHQPDRRIINWEENIFPGDPFQGQYKVESGDIQRDFMEVDESLYSLAANYSRQFKFGGLAPMLKAGVYAEHKARQSDIRQFFYLIDGMPDDFGYRDVVTQILIPENYAPDKVRIDDQTDKIDSYKGHYNLEAGYIAFNIPLQKLNIYAGLRVENSHMQLTNYTTIDGSRTATSNYNYTDLFPSLNASYKIKDNQLLRMAYGKTVNRQEFREVSPSVYYDFDLFSPIKGNPDLKPAYIQNMDMRYEFYPSKGEIISLAVFYKHFANPIEWTYLTTGGDNYTYTFRNERAANNYGVELDIKKSLEFLGLKDFSFSFNGALIESKVILDDGQQGDRPMQGQSPYLINTGFFYQKNDLNINLLYNIIGKRIVGIGRVDTSAGSTINNDIPNMYEMPRNTIDFAISKRFGIVEINASVRDLLAQKVVFKQFPKFIDSAGNVQEREQTTRSFSPGQNIGISAKINF